MIELYFKNTSFMRKSFLFFFSMFIGGTSIAQTILGRVIDTDSSAVGRATVVLQELSV